MKIEDIYDIETDLVPKELPILIYPNPNLHMESEDIIRFDDDENFHLTQLFGDLALTMVRNNGIGISAPQVGILANMLVVLAELPGYSKPEPICIINPSIVEQDGEFEWEEGCLSVPGYYEKRIRSNRIVLQYQNLTGEDKELEARGLSAFAIQHEIDHLHGELFIDTLSTLKKKFSVEKKIKNFLKKKQQ